MAHAVQTIRCEVRIDSICDSTFHNGEFTPRATEPEGVYETQYTPKRPHDFRGKALREACRIPCTTHRTPHTVHRTPYTVYHTPYTAHHTPYDVHRIPYTVHRTPYTVNRPPQHAHHAPYTVHRIPCTAHRTLSTAHRASYTVRHIPYTTHPTLYTAHRKRTPCTLHRTAYNAHRSPYTVQHAPRTAHRTPCTAHRTLSTIDTVYGVGRAACKLSGALAHTICNVRSCPKSVRTFGIQNLLHVFERLNAIFDHSCSANARISALAIEPQLTRRTVHCATRSAHRIPCTAHRTPFTRGVCCMV